VTTLLGDGRLGSGQRTQTLRRMERERFDIVVIGGALTGLGSPHWDPYARGTIVGLTRGAGRAHLARAALERSPTRRWTRSGRWSAPGGEPPAELRADGGATVNRWLMQFQADVLGVAVVVPEVPETTALGAALLAGVGASLLTLDQVRTPGNEKARYEPAMSADERKALLDGWRHAVDRSRSE
jgi:glycerol kinase